ncbi:MAG: SRPBCC domain-containing protein [Gemmatimonadetes bacterium]|nr:SRPBCC domain-containing protein [Gemmatimonadota bacterium]
MNTQTAGTDLEFRIEIERQINAPINDVFESLLTQMGEESVTHEGNALHLKIEAFPGGRWYRDLGDGNGHYWGTVQSIKRPVLMEITGPLFMSHPVTNNVQYRLEETDGVTTLKLVHTGFGPTPEGLTDAMHGGWTDQMDRITARLA